MSRYSGDGYSPSAESNAKNVPVEIYYEARELATAFDSLTYAVYPGAHPPMTSETINRDSYVGNASTKPRIQIFETAFLEWLQDADIVGLVVSLGEETGSGLVGFAARVMLAYREIEPTAVGSIVGPRIIVEFEDSRRLILPPISDTSTFHEVPSLEKDVTGGIIVRTCLRSYPVLTFDLAGVPNDGRIDRATLHLTSDGSRSFGPPQALIAGELHGEQLPAGATVASVDQLAAAIHAHSGASDLDPGALGHFALDVSTQVKGIASADGGTSRALVLTGNETALSSGPVVALDPGFYLSAFRFFGSAAEDSLRPWIEITYRARLESSE